MILKLFRVLVTFILTTPVCLFSQSSIPTARLGEWSQVGYRSDYPTTFENIHTINYRKSSGIDSVLKLVRKDTSSFDKIELLPGDYYLDRPILLDDMCSNLVIVGIGTEPSAVNLIFKDSIPGDALIRISGTSAVRNIIIENISITARSVSSADLIYNILFLNAEDCLIKNIESHKPVKQHIAIGKSKNIEVRDSYFHEAHSYGTGGSGYGVCIAGGSMYCLVENNVFRHLRHSMVLLENVTNNVFGYNYSFDQYSPLVVQGDICIHGDGVTGAGRGPGLGRPSRNLFEGNFVDRIWADDYHGKNGPYNTYFRNYSYYQFIKLEQDDSANVVGNEGVLITDEVVSILDKYGIKKDDRSAGSQYNWERPYHKNYYLSDISLYKQSKPPFISDEFTWPPIGPPLSPESSVLSQNIPARKNFLDNNPEYSLFSDNTQDQTINAQTVDNLSIVENKIQSIFKANTDNRRLVTYLRPADNVFMTPRDWQNMADSFTCEPLIYDFNGDGQCDRVFINLSDMKWRLYLTTKKGFNTTNYTEFDFGIYGDSPLAGDFNGDGKSDLCVFRDSTALWSVRFTKKSGLDFEYKSGYENHWGSANKPYMAKLADFNGDGNIDRFLYRQDLKEWSVNFTEGSFDQSTDIYLESWGISGDIPIIGDFNGDNLCDIARYNSGKLYIRLTTFNATSTKYEFSNKIHQRNVSSSGTDQN